MQILRPLSTGELFDQIFTLYRRHFLLFFFIALVPQVVEFAITDSMLLATPSASEASAQTVLITLLGRFVGFCLTAISQGATIYAVSQLYLDQPVTAVSAYSYVRPLWLRLALVQIGYSIYVGFGTLLLILPGIYFAIVYALATNVTTIEELPFGQAMDRSKFLMAGNWGRVILIFLLSLILNIVLAFGVGIGVELSSPLLARFVPSAPLFVAQLVSILDVSLATPIVLIGFTLVYYDARVRKEAFDLHHAIDTELLATDTAGAST